MKNRLRVCAAGGHLSLANRALMIRRPIKLNLQVGAVKIILELGKKVSLSRMVNVDAPEIVDSKCLVLTSARVPSDNKQVVSIQLPMKTAQEQDV